jgi:hypothetical protein
MTPVAPLITAVGAFLLFLHGTALAQSADIAAPVMQLAQSSSNAVHEYAVAAVFDIVDIPANLRVSPQYRPLLEVMLRRSPTFRRQCLRIAAEPAATVHLESWAWSVPPGARAITRMTRNASGSLDAIVIINPVDDMFELIAHELEHVIEQLEDIDLPSKATQPNTGVHAVIADGAFFETMRAVRTGLKVAGEVRAAGRGAD